MATVIGYVAGMFVFAVVCNWLHLDWRLMLMLIRDTSYGRTFVPSIEFKFRELQPLPINVA